MSLIGCYGNQKIDFAWRPIWSLEQGRKNSISRRFYVEICTWNFLPTIFMFFMQILCWYKITFLCLLVGIELRFWKFLSLLTSIGTQIFSWSLTNFHRLDKSHWHYLRTICPVYSWGHIFPPQFFILGHRSRNIIWWTIKKTRAYIYDSNTRSCNNKMTKTKKYLNVMSY